MAKKQSRRKKNAPKEPENKKEGNAFDKIFKEMAQSIFRPLVEERLGIKIKKFRPLREKMQTTIEREMDFFYEVTTDTNDVFTLHLEFESSDNPEMVYRVGEYHGIQLRRRQKPMRHVVIYLGMEPPKMRTQLRPEEVYTGFELVNVHGLNTAVLLSSQIPDMVLVAILSDYPIEHAESVLRLIVQKLKVLAKNESELTKFLSQLVMLSRLRKIEELTIKITEEMPITIDIKTDYLYNKGIEQGIERGIEQGIERGIEQGIERGIEQGIERGIEQGIERGIEQGIEQGMTIKDYENKYNFVVSLLQNSDFSDERIAFIVSVDIAFVEKTKIDLKHKKS